MISTQPSSDLIQRSITAIIFGGVMIAGIFISHTSFVILIGVIQCLCLYEFYKISFNDSNKILIYSGLLMGIFIYVLIQYFPEKYFLILPSLFLLGILVLFDKKAGQFELFMWCIMGILYISISLSLFPLIKISGHYNQWLIMLIIAIAWANDVGAYLAGRKYGNTKLLEHISPKKSWEGFITGLVIAITLSLIFNNYIQLISWQDSIIIAILIGVIGTIGDLIESMLKRNFMIKDSSSLLPGHGGLLDRFDTIIYALPFIYAYFRLFIS